MSTVIGVTIFYSDGKALEVAGPSGVLLAFAIVGAVAICVMECVSELIQMFPTPNAIVEFVRIFVDEDLAWVIGIGYWSEASTRSCALWLMWSFEGTLGLLSSQHKSSLLRTSRATGT